MNMLGAIIGDIVGSRFEFNNTDNYNFEPVSYTHLIAYICIVIRLITFKIYVIWM